MASLILFFTRYIIYPYVLGRSVPKSVMVGISRSCKVAAVSVMMAGWQLSMYVDPMYRSSYFIVMEFFSDAIGTRSKYSLPSQCTGTGSQPRFRAPGLVYFEVSYLCTFWAWRLVTYSCQSESSIHYPQVGDMVSIWPFPYPSSIFFFLCWIHILCVP